MGRSGHSALNATALNSESSRLPQPGGRQSASLPYSPPAVSSGVTVSTPGLGAGSVSRPGTWDSDGTSAQGPGAGNSLHRLILGWALCPESGQRQLAHTGSW